MYLYFLNINRQEKNHSNVHFKIVVDPLNGDAARLLQKDPEKYNKKIKEYVKKYASEDISINGDKKKNGNSNGTNGATKTNGNTENNNKDEIKSEASLDEELEEDEDN